MPTRAGTSKAHGEPPGDVELDGAKDKFGWPKQPRFYLPEDVLDFYRQALKRGAQLEEEWRKNFEGYRNDYPDLAVELDRRLEERLPEGWESVLPEFPFDEKGMASRSASGKAINALAGVLPELFGGSADLAPSTNTWMNNIPAFGSTDGEHDCRAGRNVHFGVREHAMGSIVNGLAYHGGVIPFGATFLVFSDYMRPAIRISALSHLGSIWVFTHDSIGVGEDGPTHQPVEHLAALRAIPDLITLRPADANEVCESWKIAVINRHRPTALLLTRQNLPTLDRSVFADAKNVYRGAYILADLGGRKPEIILMASGSEVHLIVKAGQNLADQGISVRLISFPSWELFQEQDLNYQESVLPPEIEKRLAVEAGISQGWHRWVGLKGRIQALDRYGASAPAGTLFEKLGFTINRIEQIALEMLK